MGKVVNSFLISCEHGGNQIPRPWQPLFRGQRALLNSHRGYDRGALAMARELAAAFSAPLVTASISRLLIDLNRSIGHPQLFSDTMREAPLALRTKIVEQHYQPYREKVERLAWLAVSRGHRLIHISSHSFTPVLDGKVRTADVGLLYDPGRAGEAKLCARWTSSLGALTLPLRIRRNYPYAGKADGLTSYLRKHFPPESYIGIELEVNQSLVHTAGHRWKALRVALIDSLRTASANLPGDPK